MNPPSRDLANDGIIGGIMASIMKKQLQATDGMLPAVVISYDRAQNIATVRPVIQVLDTDGGLTSRAQVASVPVLALGGGDFVLSFPVSPGDLGWIEASDRDISLFMQSLTDSAPNTLRMHSFSDGRFIPDKLRSYTIDGDDEGAVVLQRLSGSCKVSLRPDDTVVIKGGDGTVTIDPAGKFAFESASDELVTILKDLTDVLQDARVFGNIPFNADTIAAISAITVRLEAMII